MSVTDIESINRDGNDNVFNPLLVIDYLRSISSFLSIPEHISSICLLNKYLYNLFKNGKTFDQLMTNFMSPSEELNWIIKDKKESYQKTNFYSIAKLYFLTLYEEITAYEEYFRNEKRLIIKQQVTCLDSYSTHWKFFYCLDGNKFAQFVYKLVFLLYLTKKQKNK